MYSEIFVEIQVTKEMASFLCDQELVEEIHELCYSSDGEVSEVLYDYWSGGNLTEKSREVLEWYYVLQFVEGGYIE